MTGTDEEDERDALAAEYVLGVLTPGERAAAADLARADPVFAARVDAWQRRLDPLSRSYGEVSPPPRLKGEIERRVFAAAGTAAPVRFWERLAFWRPAAIVLFGLLAVSLAVLLSDFAAERAPDRGAVRFVAALAAEGTPVRYVVLVQGGRRLSLSHISGERTRGHDFELWLIAGDAPPVSLGIVPVGQAVEIDLAAGSARVAAGVTLAISEEPQGGSPTGRPTGPVVAAGPLLGI